MSGIVYKILNLVDGKFYIGSTRHPKIRFRNHIRGLNSNLHHNRYLQRAWNKYGESSFRFIVLEDGLKDDLLEREQFYLDTLNPDYNICKVAGSTFGIRLSDETRKKFSEVQKGIRRNIGYKHTPEARKNMSEARKLQYKLTPVSDDVRKMISERLKGKKFTDEHKKKIALSRKGTKASTETKAKMSKSHMGRPPTLGNTGGKASPETRKKQSEARKQWWERNRQET